MRNLVLGMAAGLAAMTVAAPASAAVTLLGTFSGTECSGQGGFPNCFATQTGVTQGPTSDPLASSAIYKLNSDGSTEISSVFPTINGSEFVVTLLGQTLSFTYTPGANDPVVHYFSVKQANSYALFYDAAAITSGSVNLTNFFPKNPGYSHITFFDTTNRGAVPEPATWAMMLIGFGAVGVGLRRRKRSVLQAA